ncbi:MAG: hypothetical protein N2491_01835 [Negativicutes bacterium]|nr:hypothetical protein [Negativicutes bacterium]
MTKREFVTFIDYQQARLRSKVVILKREICCQFGLKKFDDVPQELYPKASAWAVDYTEMLLEFWNERGRHRL